MSETVDQETLKEELKSFTSLLASFLNELHTILVSFFFFFCFLNDLILMLGESPKIQSLIDHILTSPCRKPISCTR